MHFEERRSAFVMMVRNRSPGTLSFKRTQTMIQELFDRKDNVTVPLSKLVKQRQDRNRRENKRKRKKKKDTDTTTNTNVTDAETRYKNAPWRRKTVESAKGTSSTAVGAK